MITKLSNQIIAFSTLVLRLNLEYDRCISVEGNDDVKPLFMYLERVGCRIKVQQ